MMKNKLIGFSLVELLVALVVASVGLLGVATLSLQATRYNFDAKLRNQATLLASDMADRIRTNPTAALTNYPGVVGVNNNCDTVTTPCTAAERAAQDIWEWVPLVAQLPNGTGTIAAAAVAPQLTITVSWDEIVGDFNVNRGSAGGTVNRSIAVTVLP